MALRYRAEIDGLRAFAVVPVILFHAGFKLFGGGFVGVDVFFVISGYLITAVLAEDIENKRFSIVDFYERRARRILPALFLVMFGCIPFAWMWMLPDPLENFGQSLVATTLFSNNVLLYLTSGYWDLASEFKPLLHTWTLGVEEQYYLIVPALLFLLFKAGRAAATAIIFALLLFSLIAAEMFNQTHPQAAFFFLPTRAWELLIGAVVALGQDRITAYGHDKVATALSFAGLCLIIGSIFVFDKNTPNPSLHMLMPTLGTALILGFSQASKLFLPILTNRVAVGIGLISYSAYLWHQPLFSFFRILSTSEPGAASFLSLTAATFALAFISWRYVEQPFRNRTNLKRGSFASIILIAAAVLIAFGLAAHKSHGFASRIFDQSNSLPEDLYISYNDRNFQYKSDVFNNNGKVRLLIIGNSFGRDVINIIRETYAIDQIDLVYRDDLTDCALLHSNMGKGLFDRSNVIVFASSYGENDGACVHALTQAAKDRGLALFFIGTKNFGYNLNWIARVSKESRSLLRNAMLPETVASERWMRELVPEGHFVSLIDALSADGKILVTDELGRLISPDLAHLTKYGAIYLGKTAFLPSAISSYLPKR